MGGCIFGNLSSINVPKCHRGKSYVFDKKFQSRLSFTIWNLESGLYPSITDFVEAMNTLIQERHNHSESCVTVKVSRIPQTFGIYLTSKRSGLAFFSVDLGHILVAMLAMNLECY